MLCHWSRHCVRKRYAIDYAESALSLRGAQRVSCLCKTGASCCCALCLQSGLTQEMALNGVSVLENCSASFGHKEAQAKYNICAVYAKAAFHITEHSNLFSCEKLCLWNGTA